MGFKDDIDDGKQDSDFYKFVAGDQKFRIMAEPIKKVSRWGHGICYDGAPYCDEVKMQEEYQAKIEKAKQDGKDPKKVEVPNLSTKYMTWAILRGEKRDRFVILELPKQLAEKIRTWMDSEEYAFSYFPMPYDITINADKNVGTTKVKYDILPARKETPITDEESLEYEKLTPIDQLLQKIKDKQERKVLGEVDLHDSIPDDEVSPDDVAF